MKYSTPELIVLGPAPMLVLGVEPGKNDNPGSTLSRPIGDLGLGLDD